MGPPTDIGDVTADGCQYGAVAGLLYWIELSRYPSPCRLSIISRAASAPIRLPFVRASPGPMAANVWSSAVCRAPAWAG